jgi:hypothetical protein
MTSGVGVASVEWGRNEGRVILSRERPYEGIWAHKNPPYGSWGQECAHVCVPTCVCMLACMLVHACGGVWCVYYTPVLCVTDSTYAALTVALSLSLNL